MIHGTSEGLDVQNQGIAELLPRDGTIDSFSNIAPECYTILGHGQGSLCARRAEPKKMCTPS